MKQSALALELSHTRPYREPNRSRRYTWKHVEAEFQAMLADESIRDRLKIAQKAYSFMLEILASIPASSP